MEFFMQKKYGVFFLFLLLAASFNCNAMKKGGEEPEGVRSYMRLISRLASRVVSWMRTPAHEDYEAPENVEAGDEVGTTIVETHTPARSRCTSSRTRLAVGAVLAACLAAGGVILATLPEAHSASNPYYFPSSPFVKIATDAHGYHYPQCYYNPPVDNYSFPIVWSCADNCGINGATVEKRCLDPHYLDTPGYFFKRYPIDVVITSRLNGAKGELQWMPTCVRFTAKNASSGPFCEDTDACALHYGEAFEGGQLCVAAPEIVRQVDFYRNSLIDSDRCGCP